MGRTIPRVRFKLLALVSCVTLLLAAAAWYSINQRLTGPLESISEPVVFEISPGSSLARVSAELASQGIIESPRLFTLFARWRRDAGSIKAGEYQIQPGTSLDELLNLIVSGNSIQYRVTIVEGWTFRQALSAIAQLDSIDHTLGNTSDRDIASLLGLPVSNPEGMIHPDTYFYTRGTSDLDLLRRARARQQQLLDEAWEQRLGALPYDNPYDALIMASIVEKESALGSERGHIAGVFVRRLERGMRLQSDPTVIYGIGQAFDGDITRSDLDARTPFNTYRIDGLPPTPIALPGEASIIASLNPVESDYMYFVATGDGRHYFSSTLEEHNAAVARFQLNRTDNVEEPR